MNITEIFGGNFKKGLLLVIVLSLIGLGLSEVTKYQNRQKITRVVTETKFASNQQAAQQEFLLANATAYYNNRSLWQLIRPNKNQSGLKVSFNSVAADGGGDCDRISNNLMGVVYMLGAAYGYGWSDDSTYLSSFDGAPYLALGRTPLESGFQQLVDEIDQLAEEWRNCSSSNN